MLYIEDIYNYDDIFYKEIYLPNDIYDKYKKYYFEKDKKVCKLSFFLKKKLSNYLGIKTFNLKYQLHGKPYLLDDKDNIINFNISHHSNLVILYYNKNKEVGVDILNRNEVKLFSYNCPVFSDEENEFVTDLEKFCKIWTAKEAYSKCLGIGLSNELNSVNLLDVISNGKYNDYQIEFSDFENKFIICKCTKF